MAFTEADSVYVRNLIWGRRKGSHGTPCNVFFAYSVACGCINNHAIFEAFMAEVRKAGKEDGAPVCAFSITQKERVWKTVLSYIEKHPKKFQTITTGSRHGKYKVMWVFFRSNGRAF